MRLVAADGFYSPVQLNYMNYRVQFKLNPKETFMAINIFKKINFMILGLAFVQTDKIKFVA